jgi:hypothetical protein
LGLLRTGISGVKEGVHIKKAEGRGIQTKPDKHAEKPSQKWTEAGDFENAANVYRNV